MQEENTNNLVKKLLDVVDKLTQRVGELETLKNDIPTAEELAAEISGKPMTLKPLILKRKRGIGFKPLMESEILEAQKGATSAAEVCRKLNVSIITYTKYAKMYGIYENVINRTGKGVSKPQNPNKGKYPLSDILLGKYPDYPIFRLKHKLLRSGLKKNCCEQCGFAETRITDGKMPLLLVFEDGNNKNHKIENIKMLCYNCSFTSGKIWMKCKKREKWFKNPDRILGSVRDTKDYPPQEITENPPAQ